MINYLDKYYKYKYKYLELKNTYSGSDYSNQIGGTLKVFNLSKSKYKDKSLQKNLAKLEKDFGNEFFIKSEDLDLEVIVQIEKITLPSDIKFYRMSYDIPHRTTWLTPFIIDFIDIITMDLNNNSYISNIQKTNKISGTNMVKLCLEINKVLGVKKVLLGDGTTIKCGKEELDLSFVKLLEYDKTFYMKLGFDFEITNHQFPYYRFTNKKKFSDEISRLLNSIRSIRTHTIVEEYSSTIDLISQMIKENYSKKLEILINNSNPSSITYVYKTDPANSILDIFEESKIVLDILNKNKDKDFLYQILIDLFKKDCKIYAVLYKYIIDNQRSSIEYGDIKISRPYVIDFSFLLLYRYSYKFSYYFY